MSTLAGQQLAQALLGLRNELEDDPRDAGRAAVIVGEGGEHRLLVVQLGEPEGPEPDRLPEELRLGTSPQLIG